jgi:cold shock CspA family protein
MSLESSTVVTETSDEVEVGKYVGQCKWFNDKLGYGFVTVQSGSDKGKDIFVHHSGVKPLNSNYKTLKKGEYVNFNIMDGENGLQAVDVTGIGGGTLMCDILPAIKMPQQQAYQMGFGIQGIQMQMHAHDPYGNPPDSNFTVVKQKRVPRPPQPFVTHAPYRTGYYGVPPPPPPPPLPPY